MTPDELSRLLELAAKAYFQQDIADGVCSFRWDEKEDAIVYIHGENQDHNGNDVELLWNPADDDGDALRLAVKLNFRIDIDRDRAWAAVIAPRHLGIDTILQTDIHGNAYAATRLAVLRAAAAIGEAMP